MPRPSVKVPPMLERMRKVMDQSPTKDRTAGEKKMRTFLNDNPNEFMRLMSHLETEVLSLSQKLSEERRAIALKREEVANKLALAQIKNPPPAPEPNAAPTAAPESDPGTEACIELCERFIREHSKTEARKAM